MKTVNFNDVTVAKYLNDCKALAIHEGYEQAGSNKAPKPTSGMGLVLYLANQLTELIDSISKQFRILFDQ